MKTKKVVLCEFHDEDVLAQTVMHLGVCEDCLGRIAKLLPKPPRKKTAAVKKRQVCSVCGKAGHNAKGHAGRKK